MEKEITFWNDFYKNQTWWSKPMPIIKFAEEHFIGTSICDLGIGDGRNVLHLISKGFSIEWIDFSPVAINTLPKDKNLTTITSDITEYLEQPRAFDNVLSTFSLRYTGGDFIKNIKSIQEYTNPWGVNVIVDFIDHKWERIIDVKILKDLYKDWNILLFEEKNIPKKNSDTEALAVFLVAKRV